MKKRQIIKTLIIHSPYKRNKKGMLANNINTNLDLIMLILINANSFTKNYNIK